MGLIPTGELKMMEFMKRNAMRLFFLLENVKVLTDLLDVNNWHLKRFLEFKNFHVAKQPLFFQALKRSLQWKIVLF